LNGFFEALGRAYRIVGNRPMKNESKSFEALFKFFCKKMKANNYRFSEYENLQMAHLEAVCSLLKCNYFTHTHTHTHTTKLEHYM